MGLMRWCAQVYWNSFGNVEYATNLYIDKTRSYVRQMRLLSLLSKAWKKKPRVGTCGQVKSNHENIIFECDFFSSTKKKWYPRVCWIYTSTMRCVELNLYSKRSLRLPTHHNSVEPTASHWDGGCFCFVKVTWNMKNLCGLNMEFVEHCSV